MGYTPALSAEVVTAGVGGDDSGTGAVTDRSHSPPQDGSRTSVAHTACTRAAGSAAGRYSRRPLVHTASNHNHRLQEKETRRVRLKKRATFGVEHQVFNVPYNDYPTLYVY